MRIDVGFAEINGSLGNLNYSYYNGNRNDYKIEFDKILSEIPSNDGVITKWIDAGTISQIPEDYGTHYALFFKHSDYSIAEVIGLNGNIFTAIRTPSGWSTFNQFATKGDLTTSGQIGWTNSEISNGVTKNFDASNYLLLVAETGTYSNVAETIIVTSSYFLSTSLGKRIMLNYDGSTIEVYHGTGNEVHIRGANIKSEQTFRIYGVLAKS